MIIGQIKNKVSRTRPGHKKRHSVEDRFQRQGRNVVIETVE